MAGKLVEQGPGRQASCPPGGAALRRFGGAPGRAAACATTSMALLAVAALTSIALLAASLSCASARAVTLPHTEATWSASAPVALVPGQAASVDMDADGVPEHIMVDAQTDRLTIRDGATVYQSREKWRFAQALVDDTDRDGLPEVVALLDAPDGRHLGLFAFFGGQYCERLVTAVLSPRPLSLDTAYDPASNGRVILLTEEPASGQGGHPAQTTYRWNGFGFTAAQGRARPRRIVGLLVQTTTEHGRLAARVASREGD